MIPLHEALEYVLEHCSHLPIVRINTDDARGLVAAEALITSEAVPPFDNTAMDGFAVRSVDTLGAPIELSIVGTQAAGPLTNVGLGPGQAIRIMTGAAIPPGADAVVMIEKTEVSSDGSIVTIGTEVTKGNHLRFMGEDLKVGDEVFSSGTILTPAHLGMLASIGCTEVSVFKRPLVGVMSTGDELVDRESELAPGQIRDANRYILLALLEELGVDVIDLGLVPDIQGIIADTILSGVSACDVVITSGGVSMGDFDYVKVVLDQIGNMRWMQVAIKPAKPLAFGLVEGVPVFGLPGNPVSSMVSFELFARPALRAMMGCSDLDRPRVQAVVDGKLFRKSDGKTHFVRVAVRWINGVCSVSSTDAQGSHQLSGMAEASGLAILPDGDGLTDGDNVEVILLR